MSKTKPGIRGDIGKCTVATLAMLSAFFGKSIISV